MQLPVEQDLLDSCGLEAKLGVAFGRPSSSSTPMARRTSEMSWQQSPGLKAEAFEFLECRAGGGFGVSISGAVVDVKFGT